MRRLFTRRALAPASGLLAALVATVPCAAQPLPPQPGLVQVLPAEGSVLAARAVLAVLPAKPLTSAPRAVCDVGGVRSSVPTEVLKGAERSAALKALNAPDTRADEPAWVVLRCQTSFPDGAPVTLRWLDPQRDAERSLAGQISWGGQRLSFTARSDWPASVVCPRSNASSGCSPLDPVTVQLTVSVNAKALMQLRLRNSKGQLLAPQGAEFDDDGANGRRPMARSARFVRLSANETYTLVWPASLDDARGNDVLAQARSKPPMRVTMGPYPPLAKFGASFGIAEKAIGGVVPLTVRGIEGAQQTGSLRLRSLRVTDEPGIIEALQTLQRLVYRDDFNSLRRDGDADDTGDDGDAEPAAPAASAASKAAPARWAFKLPASKNGEPVDSRSVSWLARQKGVQSQALPRKLDGRAFEVLGIPLGQSGLHLLEVESRALGRGLLADNKTMFVRAGALVSNLAVHMHWSDRTRLVWVTRLNDGQPVAGAQVSLYDCKGNKLGQGRTQDAGWVQIDAASPRGDRWNCPLYAFARTDDDLGMASSQWQRGIESWRFEGLPNAWADTSADQAHAVLARNLLRPGETLHARLYWRTLSTRGQLQAPDTSKLPTQLHVVHQGSGDRRSLPLLWDGHGHAEVVWPLPAGLKRGAYMLEAGNRTLASVFRVEEFRLPVLKAEVLSPPAVQVMPGAGQGGQVSVGLRLSYLSGGPAAGEKATVSQRLLPHRLQFADYPDFYFGNRHVWRDDEDGDGDAGGKPIALPDDGDDDLVMAADGTAQKVATLPPRLDAPRALVTEMEYRDPNGETYRAQGRTVLWPAQVALGSKIDWWASGKQRKAEFVVLNPQGQPQAGVAIKVQGGIDGRVWHRRKTVGGFYSYTSEVIQQKLRPLCQGQSGPDGRFVCSFEPAASGAGGEVDSGEFKLLATAHDAQGRQVQQRSSLWFYAGDEVWFDQGDHDRMDVLPEKRRYQAGDVATIQVRSPFREATAWVNVMRAGTVIDTLVLPLSGRQPTLSLPIKPGYAPNVFINVMAVRGRVAEPAATALVDLARPAYKLGLAHLEVGSDAQKLNVQVATDKPAYQSRETARVSIQVSAAQGSLPARRNATVMVIDEALLELLPNPTWDLLQAMMVQRGYGFESASAAMQVLGKRHYGRKALPPGGGGGKSASRELFDTLLLWQAQVPLDEHGQAQVKVPINDSLTRFRVVVVADAGTDRFGTGQASFVATRDLQLLPGLPATVREGDRYTASFTLRNAGGQPLQASVAGQLDGRALPARSASLAPGATQLIQWPVEVPFASTEQRWQVQAQAQLPNNQGERRDAVTVKQAVSPALNPVRYTVATLTLTQETATAAKPLVGVIQPPAGSVPGRGEVRVTLSPALAADAAGVRDYMRSYPFFCLEQRTSKAVSLKDMALWQVISDTVDQYITPSGLVNYYPGQNGYDQGYDVLTAFVLSASHEAGWQLPDDARRRMLAGLEQFVQGKLQRSFAYDDSGALGLTERKLLALEALARHGQPAASLADSLRVDAQRDLPQLSNRAIVQWLDVLSRVQWPQRQRWQQQALAELDKRLADDQRGGLRLRPRTGESRWYWMTSDEASQVRLALLAQDLPALSARADRLALGAVNMQKNGGHWWPTQANVWGALMLDKRAQRLSGQTTGRTTVAFGTQTMLHDWQQMPQGHTYSFAATQISPDKPGAVAFVHQGGGRPMAITQATAWSALSAPLEQGAHLSRTVTAIKQRVPGQWSAGDIVKVQLRFKLKQPGGWVALTDPIPPGATVLGSGLGGLAEVQEGQGGRQGWRNSDGSWEQQPSYLERGFTQVRAYYEYLWSDEVTLSYQLRINTPGRFALPPTQLEGMYDPQLFAYQPNAVMEVR